MLNTIDNNKMVVNAFAGAVLRMQGEHRARNFFVAVHIASLALESPDRFVIDHNWLAVQGVDGGDVAEAIDDICDAGYLRFNQDGTYGLCIDKCRFDGRGHEYRLFEVYPFLPFKHEAVKCALQNVWIVPSAV